METLTLAAATAKALPFLLAMAMVAVALCPRMAGPDTQSGPSSQEQLMNALRAKSLLELGMPVVDGLRYRRSRIRDTQDIAVANDTELKFFSTATSQESLHALGRNGCNLREIGKVDERTAGLVVAFGLRIRGLFASVAATVMTDIAKLIDDLYLDSLLVDGIMLFEDIPAIEMARNLGSTPLLAGALATFQLDGVTLGQPGFPDLGYTLEPYERFTLIGGQKIEAKFRRNSGAGVALAAVRSLRFELITTTALPARS